MSIDIASAKTSLNLASRAIKVAVKILDDDELRNDVCFHAHKSIEHSLKGMCMMHNIKFPYSHDLMRLLPLVESYIENDTLNENDVASMSNYAVSARYDDAFFATKDEALAALNKATDVHICLGVVIAKYESSPEDESNDD